MRELQDIIDAYVRYSLRSDPADFWAWDRTGQIVRGEDAEQAFELVRRLVAAAPEDRLGYVGAGPMEDFVKRHGAALVDWIVAEAMRDPGFRAALASLWLRSEDLPADVIRRLQSATGGQIHVAAQADIDAAELPAPPDEPG